MRGGSRSTCCRPGPGRPLWLYLGDDWTDEHAFEVLKGLALTIRVGRHGARLQGGLPAARRGRGPASCWARSPRARRRGAGYEVPAPAGGGLVARRPSLVVGAFAYFQFVEERQRLTGELDRRAALVSEGLKEVLEPALGPRVSKPQIDRLIKKFSKPDLGLAVYDRVASLIAATPDVTKQLENPPPEATWALTSGAVQTGFRKVGGTIRYVYADPILREDKPAGALVVFLDASDLQTAEWELLALQRHPVPGARGRPRPDRAARRPHEPDPAARQDGALDQGGAARPRDRSARAAGREPLRADRPGGHGAGQEPPAGAGRRRGGGRAAPDRPDPVDRGAAQAVRQDAARRAAAGGGLEPRAGQPRLEGGRRSRW